MRKKNAFFSVSCFTLLSLAVEFFPVLPSPAGGPVTSRTVDPSLGFQTGIIW
jgi:hypothetical protein